MLIITAPGQGAQTPGFLAPWLELPGVAERLGAASELAGCDLVRFGTTASADEIKDTAVAQPLLVAAAIVAASALSSSSGSSGGPGGDVPADAAAGHSVGELAAGVIAGVLTADDAMRLVAVRGRAMAAAAAAEPTGMTAVLGGDQEAVLAAIARHGLTPANVNAGRPDRGRRDPGGAGRLRGRPARRGAAAPAAGRGGLPHPAHGPGRSRAAGRGGRRRGRRSGHRPCCPTPTEPRSPPARSGWSASSPRSPRRCAGTCACVPWPTSA